MPQFTTVSSVPVPPDAAFAFVLDLTQWPLFTGYGPLPGILAAKLPPGETVQLGSRIHVDDADGRHHFERVEVFEPGRRLALRMELVPPASFFMADIYEEVRVEAVNGGTRVTRTFTATPRAWYTWPFAWLFGNFFLSRAVDRHNAAVAARVAAG